MSDFLLFKQPNIEIYLNEADQWLYVKWIGFQTADSVKYGCEYMLHYLKEYKCQKVLNDNILVEGMWSGAAKWGADVWFPAMFAAGLRSFAWVYAHSVLSQLSTDKTLSLMDVDFIRTFYDLEKAAAWLRSV
ncbi:MAG TPA: hypothetical protein VF610_13620 [Segetibacter sp.]